MATGDTLHVEVVTADRELYNGEANIVDVPGADGQLGILPHHAALLALLKPGPLVIKLNGAEEAIFVSGGFLEVSNNSVTVLADTAERAEDINEARAEAARRRAQERLADVRSNTERAQLQAALERAVNRIRVAEMVRESGGRTRVKMPRSEDYTNN
ncbi:F0F1 ATP synthase subunit epsilon [Tengunoibacter tsumagoiensis]|uniref:ATP synthase epsilon chain n=1 Tax=Tengunoibacter tsumagoiensis TaxID=2014871 RepID=A0A402A5L5_9CHLR|nr:F0F1 ATP synthase subunit epsilon [Tengunoibacter tsumagoiensis]GCE14315.1 ATP synthase epsilon chain [Tengunoibacter tsumagoiensis]